MPFFLPSDPTTHFVFVPQIRLTEFGGEISLFAKHNTVMENQNEGNDKEQWVVYQFKEDLFLVRRRELQLNRWLF